MRAADALPGHQTERARRERRTRRHAFANTSVVTMAWVCGAGVAAAQVSAPPSPPVAPPSSAASQTTLGEVIVTARQRSENLQNTPFSIAAVGAQKLQDLNVQTTMDLDNKVPGLVLRPDNNRLEPFIGIRGVGDISRNPGIDNRTGIYLDGAPLGRSSAVDYPIYDIQSVEVLRGPQGTLFGNNSLTGVLSIQSEKPTQDEHSRFTFDAGSRNLFSGSGYFNTPLTDNLAMRVTIAGKSQDGYYKNDFNDSTLGGGTDFAGRVQFRYTPTATTIVDLSADAVSARDNILLGVGQFTTGPEVGLPNYHVNENFEPTRERTLYGFTATVQQKLPLDYTLTSISSYRSSNDRLTYDGDGTPLTILNVNIKYNDYDISQEVRVASPKYKYFDYVVGAFYYHQNPSELSSLLFGSDYPTAAVRGVTAAGGGKVGKSPVDRRFDRCR